MSKKRTPAAAPAPAASRAAPPPPDDIIPLDTGYQQVQEHGVAPFVAFVESGALEFFKAKDFVKLYE